MRMTRRDESKVGELRKTTAISATTVVAESESRVSSMLSPKPASARGSGQRKRVESRHTKVRSGIVIGLALLAILLTGPPLGVVHVALEGPLISGGMLQPQVFKPQIPILIEGDSGFTADNGVTGGSGRAGDPFVIEGLVIDMSQYAIVPCAGIFVSDTRAYFVMRNLHVLNGETRPSGVCPGGARGIFLFNVTNGEIDNSQFETNDVGLSIGGSSQFNKVTGNIFTSNQDDGVLISLSSFNTFSHNQVSGTTPITNGGTGAGFASVDSSHNTFISNVAFNNQADGFFMVDDSANTLSFNTAYNNSDGFGLVAVNDILISNTAYGNGGSNGITGFGFRISSSSSVRLVSNRAYDNQLDGFYLTTSSQNALDSNVAYNNAALDPGPGAGFSVSTGSTHNILRFNTAYNNPLGFYVEFSSQENSFLDNTAYSNGDGFSADITSSLNSFARNTVTNNNGAGFLMEGGPNTVESNTVSGNVEGVYLLRLASGISISKNVFYGNDKQDLFGGGGYGIWIVGTMNNKVTSNVVVNNPVGIEIDTIGAGSIGNSFYNNFLSNTRNAAYRDGGYVSTDQWNTTKTAGTNIIGGPYLGGNFWSDYAGTDTDRDGLGDTLYHILDEYLSTSGNDQYPLVIPSSTGGRPDFGILSIPSSTTVSEGSNGTYAIALTGQNGFSGPLALSATILPNPGNGPQISFNPTSLTLSPGMTAVSILTASDTLAATVYKIEVTASGQLVHTASLTLIINSQSILSAVRGIDNSIYTSNFNSSWSNWQFTSGETASPPVLCGSASAGLIARGSDNSSIWHKSYSSGVLSVWDSPGGATIDQPACAFLDGVLHIVVRGVDNGLWYNARNETSGSWRGWVSLSGLATSSPVLVPSPSADRMDLIVHGSGTSLWHKAYANGAWSTLWDSPGGETSASPAADSDGAVLHLVVRGLDNGLWYNSLNFTTGSWSSWLSLKGTTGYNPALSGDASGNAHLVVVGTDGSLWHMMKPAGGNWSMAWDHLGGITSNSPALTFGGSMGLVVVRSSDGSVWYNTLTGSVWTGWIAMGGTITGDPQIVTIL